MKPSYSLRCALLAAAIFISIKLLVFVLHAEFSGIGIYSGLISLALLSIPLFLGIKHKRDSELGGYITIRQVMIAGVFISALTSLIVAAYTFLHYKFIDLDVISYWTEQAKVLGAKEHKSAAEIEDAIIMLQDFYSPFKQATGVLTGILGVGTVMSFMLSTFLAKRGPASEN